MDFKTLFPEIDWATTDSICLGRDRELTASSVASAIVSFSNGKGGVLALGVSSSGEPDGLDLNSLEGAKRSLLSLLENRLSGEVRYRFILRSFRGKLKNAKTIVQTQVSWKLFFISTSAMNL